jgi:hypothetical protein
MDFPLLQRGIEGDLKTRFGQEWGEICFFGHRRDHNHLQQ